jgi:hypothetical protein
MPVLQHEHPSDEALRRYLLESVRTLAEDFTFRCAEHWENEGAWLDDFRALGVLGFDELWRQLATAVNESLRRMNRLDRADSF